MSLARLLAVLALAVTLAGCPTGPVAMPPVMPTAAELLAQLLARQQQVRTLKAEAKVEFWDNRQGDRLKARMSMWVTREGRLRFDIDSQLGPLSSVAVANGVFQLLDVRADKYFTGEAVPCNVEQIIHIALSPEDAAAALLGDAPVYPHDRTQVAWNGTDRRWVLTLELTDGAAEVLEFTDRDHYLARAELRRDGKRLWWLEHSSWTTQRGITLPGRSRFQQGDKQDQDVDVKMKSQEVNATPPDAAWVIAAPTGMVQQELRCAPH
jgi:hypothetical protein